MPKFVEQGDEIKRICGDAGLTPDEMADRVALQRDSMRKIINGYQPCSVQLMQSFRNIAEFERLRRGKYPGRPEEIITPSLLREEFRGAIRDFTEIAETEPKKARQIVEVIHTYRQALNQERPKILNKRGLPISSKVRDALEQTSHAEAEIENKGRSSSPSPGAAAPNEHKVSPSRGTGSRRKSPPSTGAKAPK